MKNTSTYKKEIESKRFTVHLKDGTSLEYKPSEDTKYLWAIGMAGEIQIMRRLIHTQISAIIREDRVLVIADREWVRVEVFDDED